MHEYLMYKYTTQIKIGLLITMFQCYCSEEPQTLLSKSINL